VHTHYLVLLCCCIFSAALVVPSSLLRLPHTAVSTLAVVSLHFTCISLQTLHSCAFFKDIILCLFLEQLLCPTLQIYTAVCKHFFYICCCPKSSSCCLFLCTAVHTHNHRLCHPWVFTCCCVASAICTVAAFCFIILLCAHTLTLYSPLLPYREKSSLRCFALHSLHNKKITRAAAFFFTPCFTQS